MQPPQWQIPLVVPVTASELPPGGRNQKQHQFKQLYACEDVQHSGAKYAIDQAPCSAVSDALESRSPRMLCRFADERRNCVRLQVVCREPAGGRVKETMQEMAGNDPLYSAASKVLSGWRATMEKHQAPNRTLASHNALLS